MIILENQLLTGRVIYLPIELVKHLSQVLVSHENCQNCDGYKRLKHILYPNYNKQDNASEQSKPCVKYNELKRIKNFFDNYGGGTNGIEYILNGGTPMKTWVDNTLTSMRSEVDAELRRLKNQTISRNSALKPQKDPARLQKAFESQSRNKQVINEGSWGYDIMDSDGACDLRADLIAKLLKEICKELVSDDKDYVWFAVGNAVYFMEKLKEQWFWNTLERAVFDLTLSAVTNLRYHSDEWIDDWKEPEEMRKSLENIENRLRDFEKQTKRNK